MTKSQERYAVKNEILTVNEAADHLGVSVEAVREWIKAGDLPAMRFGGKIGYRIARDDWERFLLARKAATAVMVGN